MSHTRRRAQTQMSRRVAALAAVALVVLAGCAGTDGDPATSELAGGVHLGEVELVAGDLDELQRFYTDGVGLTTISEDDSHVVLGVDGTGLLRLTAAEDDALAPADPSEAGLYHSAFLYPEATELAEAVLRTASLYPESFQGASDHSVSEAFYFADPEGNGVELYGDRPADTWTWEDGLVAMGSAALDPNAFIGEHLAGQAPADRATDVSVGHVHLRGGDLEQAETFYVDTVGLAVTSRGEGALFLAADGYHHHLAVNTWSSAGAGTRPASLGLGSFSVVVPDEAQLDAVADRLAAAGHDVEESVGELRVDDPWGNLVVLRVAA